MIKNLFFLCFSFLLIASACKDTRNEEALQEIIDAEVEKKINNFIVTRDRVCREDLLERASEIADSILIEEARRKKSNLDKPEKPIKPTKPIIKELTDTTSVRPLIEG